MPGVVLALAATAVGILATRGAWADIAYIAQKDIEASHIVWVPPVMAWLLLIRRRRLTGFVARPSLLGLLLIAAGWVVGHWGFNHAHQAAWHAGALLVVMGCLIGVMGWDLIRRLWPAFVVLVFIVPVPGMVRQELAIPLQTATAHLTERIFRFADLPVMRSGNHLEINGHGVDVVEACNGMRLVFPLFLVAYVFCFSLRLRPIVRAIVLLLSPAVAVLCNVIRLIPTTMLRGYASEDTFNHFHDIAGYFMIPLAFFILLLLILAMERLGLKPLARAGDDGGGRVGAKPQAIAGDVGHCSRLDVRFIIPIACLLLLAAMTTLDQVSINWSVADAFLARCATAANQIPRDIGDWRTKQDTPLRDDEQAILHANAYLNRCYKQSSTGHEVSFMLVQCKDPRDMVGHFPPICYKGQGWILERSSTRYWDVEGLGRIHGAEYLFSRESPVSEGSLQKKRVIRDFFIHPDGRIDADMAGVGASVKDYRTLPYGVAQIQLLFDDPDLSAREQDDAFAALIRASVPLIKTLRSAEGLNK